MKRLLHQRAYVLHSRAYRETSALVEVWSYDQGRLTVVARGVRKNKSQLAGLLQPFTPLLLSFVGRGELFTLTGAEIQSPAKPLKQEGLFAGLYLNELIMYLLQRFDPHPRLYLAYEAALTALVDLPLRESVLRQFELILLSELGYGLFPSSDEAVARQFSNESSYLYFHEQGFVPDTQIRSAVLPANHFAGTMLRAIAKGDWSMPDSLSAAKRLMRLALQPLLGTKAVYSRQLFLPPEETVHA